MKYRDVKKVIIFVIVILLFLGNFSNFTIADDDKKDRLCKDLIFQSSIKRYENRKIEKNIISLLDDYQSINNLNNLEGKNLAVIDNKVRLEVILIDEEYLDSLMKFSDDVEIENHYKSLVQVLIPINLIRSLSEEGYVQYIRSPVRPHLLDVTSEGVGVIGANLVHNAGVNGNGVKVAIIDVGFEDYDTNPELPSSQIVEAISFRSDGDLECGIYHGCACAEIVLDVAPQADLYLYNFETISELNNAVSHAISVGVDIISFSIGYTYINNFDGIGYSGIGDVCGIVDNAQSNDILFIVSAGNEANHHYEGTYTDNNGNDWHEFGPNDEELNLGYLPGGTFYYFELTWNDWPYSDQDYDLVLFDSWFNLIDWSMDPQTGTQPPNDWIMGFTPYGDWYYLDILRWDATQAVDFELYGDSGIPFSEYNHPESSLSCPADAFGSMTAGATYWQDDSLESFSSRGPTNDGRIKPDVTAPDGVSTYAYGSGNFYGTSASSPHAAGAAALLLSAGPLFTANALQNLLEITAVDLGPTGKDNSYGSGRISVWNAYNYIKPTADFSYSPSAPSTQDVILFIDASTDNDGAIVSWSWNFGDGTTSTTQHPTHQYVDNGTYTVTLTVTDDDGVTNETSQQIVVSNVGPIANFTYYPLFPTDLQIIAFTDNSTDVDGYITSWSWDFGDGNTSTAQNPNHQYTDDGTYIVNLTITDDDGATNVTSQQISILNVAPSADFIYSPTDPTNKNVIQFFDNSTDSDGNIVSWLWDFEDGNTSLVQNPSHRYVNNGTYNVTLVITDDDGATDSIIKMVTVTEAPPVLYNISGSVFYNGTGDEQIFVVLVDEFVNGTQPINYTIIPSPDSYLFSAPNGTYYLGAWMDINNDSFYDEEEPAGFAINSTIIQGPDPVDVNGSDVPDIDITLFAPPVVSDIPDYTIDEGNAFVTIDLDDYVNDLDNDDNEITWTYSGNVELGITIVNHVASINIPNSDWFGSETITFTATDTDDLNDSDNATFTVISINDPPVITTTDIPTATEDVLYFVDYEANDVEGDTLNWILKTNATFLSIISSSGNLTGTPENADVGSYWVNVSVNDGNNGSDSHNFTLNVINVNDPPVVTDIPDEIILEGDNFTAFDLDYYVDDIDNSDSEISWIALGQTNLTITIDSNHIVNITTPHANWNGTETVTFNASDPEGLFDFDAATFIVTPVDIIEINETGVQNISWMDTNITINVTAPTNITFAQYPQNPHPENPPYNSLNKYIDIEIENWSVVNPPVIIKIYYTQNDLDDAGLTEDQLAGIHFWNSTAGEWQLYNDTGVNITYNQSGYEGYCWVNAWHLTPLTLGGDNEPPSKVTGLSVTDAKDGKLDLSWNPAGDNVGVDHYKIYRDGGFLINITTTSYQDTGLTNDQSYSYQISAVDRSGNEGEKSDSKSGAPTSSGGGDNGGNGDGGGNLPLPPPPLLQNSIPTANAGGPYYGFVDGEIEFDGTQSSDSDGNITSWFWDFGDGTNGAREIITHTYSSPGIYAVSLTVTDDDSGMDTNETIAIVSVPNNPPSNPLIEGPTSCNKNTGYSYIATSTDLDNDSIKYIFDWGDGNTSTTELLPNGTSTTQNHTWTSPAIFIVSVYAEDENNATSDTVELTVLIDALYCSDIGYIIDSDSDGIYDLFYSNMTGDKTVLGQKDESHLIDNDGDGEWDYIFNHASGEVTPYAERHPEEFPWLIVIIGIIMAIILIIAILFKIGWIYIE